MTDWLLAQIPVYGIWIIALTTYLACLGLPMPSSVILVAAGGFIASGDIALLPAAIAAYSALFLGNQTGYFIGRKGEAILGKRLNARPVEKARAYLQKRGGMAVFLSRWLVSPISPFINYAAGLAPLAWSRFTPWSIAGEIVWLGLYLGIGYTALGNLEAFSGTLLNILGFIAALAATLGLGWWLRQKLRKLRAEAQSEQTSKTRKTDTSV